MQDIDGAALILLNIDEMCFGYLNLSVDDAVKIAEMIVGLQPPEIFL